MRNSMYVNFTKTEEVNTSLKSELKKYEGDGICNYIILYEKYKNAAVDTVRFDLMYQMQSKFMDISRLLKYDDTNYDKLIYQLLLKGIDANYYIDKVSWDWVPCVLTGLYDGIDITKYADLSNREAPKGLYVFNSYYIGHFLIGTINSGYNSCNISNSKYIAYEVDKKCDKGMPFKEALQSVLEDITERKIVYKDAKQMLNVVCLICACISNFYDIDELNDEDYEYALNNTDYDEDVIFEYINKKCVERYGFALNMRHLYSDTNYDLLLNIYKRYKSYWDANLYFYANADGINECDMDLYEESYNEDEDHAYEIFLQKKYGSIFKNNKYDI